MELYDVLGAERSELRFERFSLASKNFGWAPGDPQLTPRARLAAGLAG